MRQGHRRISESSEEQRDEGSCPMGSEPSQGGTEPGRQDPSLRSAFMKCHWRAGERLAILETGSHQGAPGTYRGHSRTARRPAPWRLGREARSARRSATGPVPGVAVSPRTSRAISSPLESRNHCPRRPHPQFRAQRATRWDGAGRGPGLTRGAPDLHREFTTPSFTRGLWVHGRDQEIASRARPGTAVAGAPHPGGGGNDPMPDFGGG